MHKTVMKNQTIKYLDIKQNGTYLDFTYGIGGHSKEIIKYINKYGTIIATDKNIQSYKMGKKKNIQIFNITFEKFKKNSNFKKNINGVLIDTGISLNQIKKKKNGKSFKTKTPLDMRINKKQKLKANDWLNIVKKKDLILFLSKFIKKNIVKNIIKKILIIRKKKKIKISNDINILNENNTKIYNLIRILINNDLFKLNNLIKSIKKILKENGTIISINFNTTENKIIKNSINKKKNYIIKKPNIKELNKNYSSRSATMRIFKKIN